MGTLILSSLLEDLDANPILNHPQFINRGVFLGLVGLRPLLAGVDCIWVSMLSHQDGHRDSSSLAD